MRKLSYVLFILCILLFSINLDGYSQELSHMGEEGHTEMYVSMEDLIFSESGIFLISGDGLNLLPVASLSWHSPGIFLAGFTRDPGCGHPLYCERCGGCDPRNRCGYRCKCTRWGN